MEVKIENLIKQYEITLENINEEIESNKSLDLNYMDMCDDEYRAGMKAVYESVIRDLKQL